MHEIAPSSTGRIFYGITNSLVLTPALAALGWIVSDSLVFGNSLLVRRFHLSNRINSENVKLPIVNKK
jgi:hypothetical protein